MQMIANQALVNNFYFFDFLYLYDFRTFLSLICTSKFNFVCEIQKFTPHMKMKIHLRKKKLKSGMTSLYIEYYKGHTTTPEGKSKILRDFEYLELYLTTDPKTAAEKKKNRENLELADQILAIRKAEVYQGTYNIQNGHKEKTGLWTFMSNTKCTG